MQGLVTVFGGTGFLGAQVVRALAKTGARIRVAARNPGRGYKLRMLGDVGQIEVVQANIRNPQSIARALDGAEACINLVSVLFESGKQDFRALNVDGARAIAEAAKARGLTRFVQMSALGADPESPSVYARTKAEGEAVVRGLIPSAVIIRPSIVFGPEDNFFNKFAAMAMVSPVLPLVGGGETRFAPVYVGDVATAVARALTDPAAPGQIYELGGPAVYSFRELMALVVKEIHRKRLLLTIPFPVAGVIGKLGDFQAAARNALGLIPPPAITSDQVELLRADNVVSGAYPGLADLGVQASAVEPILPTYLYRYRKGGQFADLMAEAGKA